MAKRKQRRKHGFARFCIAWAALLLCIGLVGIRFLWSYIKDYEDTQAVHYIDAYMQTLDPEHISAMCTEFIDSLNPDLQNRAVAVQTIQEYVGDGLTCRRKSSDAASTDIVYSLRLNGAEAGEVEIRQKEEATEYGFHNWETVRESLAFPELIGGDSITVDTRWTVLCNGVELDDSYVTETGIRYDFCKEYYDSSYSMPTMETYAVDNIIGEASFEVLDQNGNVVDMGSLTDRDAMLNNCTEEQLARVNKFFEGFVKSYVYFSSGVSNDHLTDYYNLSQYTVAGSDLNKRLYQAIEGLTYTNTKSAVVRTLELKNCMHLESGEYLCDVVYTVDNMNYYQTEYTRTVSELKVILVETSNGLKASEMLTVRTGLADGTE